MEALIVILAIAGALINSGGMVPYALQTMRGRTKPRLVTWSVWTVLATIAAIASGMTGDLQSSFFAGMTALTCGMVAAAGMRYGDRSVEIIDWVSIVLVAIGLVLWYIFNSPAVAVIAVIIIDLIGYIPTYRHAWRRPFEETISTYFYIAIGGIMATGAALLAGGFSVTGIAYPLYCAIAAGICGGIIVLRRDEMVPPEQLAATEAAPQPALAPNTTYATTGAAYAAPTPPTERPVMQMGALPGPPPGVTPKLYQYGGLYFTAEQLYEAQVRTAWAQYAQRAYANGYDPVTRQRFEVVQTEAAGVPVPPPPVRQAPVPPGPVQQVAPPVAPVQAPPPPPPPMPPAPLYPR
ncbi:hypothetical protein JNJ66_01565 [Candidatus Saccharibacteria bacterium]|nr:hypothetical protein [Candidatus Saccharibacteria bacterium]